MPILVACPNCAGQLRVADELIGRKVRCPACQATFDSTPPPPDKPSRPAVETERIDPWKSFDPVVSPNNPPTAPAPHGVRELDPRDDIDAPRPQRPILTNDHDDVRPCPGCARMIHRDASRCVACGHLIRRDEPDDDYPRFDRRQRKGDWEPHRGGFVLTMGLISLITPFTCGPFAIFSLVPGLMAWIMGAGDLRKMQRGEMDPDGQSNTQAGWICGIIGTLISTLVVITCGVFVGFVTVAAIQESNSQQRRKGVPPPIVVPNQQP